MTIPEYLKVAIWFIALAFPAEWMRRTTFPSFNRPERSPRSVAELRMSLLLIELRLENPNIWFFGRFKLNRRAHAIYGVLAGALEQMEYEGHGREVNEEWRMLCNEKFPLHIGHAVSHIAFEKEPWPFPLPKDESEKRLRERVNDVIASARTFRELKKPGRMRPGARGQLKFDSDARREALKLRDILYKN